MGKQTSLHLQNDKKTALHLHNCDCIAGMREHCADQSIDVVVTSPPYNIGIKYSTYQDTMSWDDYAAWTVDWITQVRRILKDEGSFFLNIGCAPSMPMLPHKLIDHIVNQHQLFTLQNTIHWVKSIAIEDHDKQLKQRGHYKPINSPRYLNDCHEYVFHLTKAGTVPLQRKAIGIPYADKSNIGRWGHTSGSDLKCRGNTWFIPYKTIKRRAVDRPHPATFPTALAENCIRLHGLQDDTTILDPFHGIGHSALAAIECNVNEYTGFEIDPAYLQVSLDEIASTGMATQQKTPTHWHCQSS